MPTSFMRQTLRCAALSLLLLCPPVSADDSLYRDLGGKEGITAVVDAFLQAVIEDERIVHHFKGANITRLREKLIEQFCEVSGGPCEYTGETMEESHRGMNLTTGDFNALVEDLQTGMRNVGISLSAENRLIARLAPMHGDIVHQ